MISLATRGYLWPLLGQITVECGPGPEIVGVTEPSPAIGGSVRAAVDAPSISGQVQPGPTLSTGASVEEVGDDAPSITGSSKPEID